MIDTMPKKADAESRSRRVINFRITEDDLWDALEEFVGRHRFPPTKTDIVTVALQDFLRKEGVYPRKKSNKKPDA